MEETIRSEIESIGTCEACGVEIRTGSDFCYNCGGKVSAGTANKNKTIEAVADVKENGFRSNGPGDIAGPQKRDRRRMPNLTFAHRKEPIQVVWKRADDGALRFLLISILLFVITVALVSIAYYLK